MATISDLQPRKREPLAGTRKATTLSAAQLERKRANDRKAQRYIRRRAKEYIEHLEHQVTELKSRAEYEIRTLKHQLAMTKRGQTSSNPKSLIMNPVSRIPSALSASSQVSVASDWHQYGCTRPEPICESTGADCLNRVEPFMFEDQLQASNPAKVATSQNSFNPPRPNLLRQEEYQHNPRHAVQCAISQRSMPVPTILSERELLGPIPTDARDSFPWPFVDHMSLKNFDHGDVA
ncbi:hypothetical protein BDV37DRAFT_277299 [Aspergillus pseudonomiae]|uniref:BZIP domain-containing protein n=1 Tax=Aspergillus pseudonomiae TaxID=1506151 RepID=A0A5N7CTB6_9EURO|nr:uncharacterized protein BDV37DRAFT_277299 [Aspergillus pseudonomiae]KAE8396937.1 hypothetical protein BDV37DRAFT_277299 [Aspergillus pseudonomiae]